jgi:predicted nucleic-acid-binding protein
VIAIDTNVLVRLLVNDDEAQGSRARAAFEVEDIWIGKTVLLETFWVLRSVYDFDDTAIARAIEGALGLPRVQVEDAERVKLALAAVADGIDIADALHVAPTPGDARAFATFDRDLARRGKGRLSPIEVL